MGSLASKIAEPYVFPIPQNISKNNSVELFPKNDYEIPYIHLKHTDPRAVLLYFHGNSEDLEIIEPFLRTISDELKVEVISFDYCGYGQHQGLDTVKPSEQNVYEDAELIYGYADLRSDELGVQLYVWGRSLGSAPAIHIASKYDPSGLIVESGFRSIAKVVSNNLASVFDMFDNESKIQKVRSRTLFIHGRQDHIVPFSHGEKLFDLCNSPKECFWIDHGCHNNLDSTYHSELLFRVMTFIK